MTTVNISRSIFDYNWSKVKDLETLIFVFFLLDKQEEGNKVFNLEMFPKLRNIANLSRKLKTLKIHDYKLNQNINLFEDLKITNLGEFYNVNYELNKKLIQRLSKSKQYLPIELEETLTNGSFTELMFNLYVDFHNRLIFNNRSYDRLVESFFISKERSLNGKMQAFEREINNLDSKYLVTVKSIKKNKTKLGFSFSFQVIHNIKEDDLLLRDFRKLNKTSINTRSHLKQFLSENSNLNIEELKSPIANQMQCEYLLSTFRNMFITGLGGTGKTFTVNKYIHKYTSKYGLDSVLILASTNLAKNRYDYAKTWQSFLKYDIEGYSWSDNKHRISPKKLENIKKQLNNSDVIVIDEVSMISEKDLIYIRDCFDDLLGENLDKKQIIFIGDPLQLDPVATAEDLARFGLVAKEQCIGTKVWESFNLLPFQLEEIKRTNDYQLKRLLNNMVTTDISDALLTLKYSNLKRTTSSYKEDSIVICGKNSTADYINHLHQENHNPNDYVGYKIETKGLTTKDKIENNVFDFQYFKLNDPIIITNNIAKSNYKVFDKVTHKEVRKYKELVNGSLGKIIKLEENSIYIEIEDLIYKLNKKVTFNVPGFSNKKYTRWPLKLAYALTAHKLQGQTIEKNILILFSDFFTPKQAMVALGRAKYFDKVYLSSAFSDNNALFNAGLIVKEKDKLVASKFKQKTFYTTKKIEKTVNDYLNEIEKVKEIKNELDLESKVMIETLIINDYTIEEATAFIKTYSKHFSDDNLFIHRLLMYLKAYDLLDENSKILTRKFKARLKRDMKLGINRSRELQYLSHYNKLRYNIGKREVILIEDDLLFNSIVFALSLDLENKETIYNIYSQNKKLFDFSYYDEKTDEIRYSTTNQENYYLTDYLDIYLDKDFKENLLFNNYNEKDVIT